MGRWPYDALVSLATLSPPSATGRLKSRLYALDGLRFVAALAVVGYHFVALDTVMWGRPVEGVFPTIGLWATYGALGPQLFFVISGFVILMTAWGRDVPSIVASRFARLFPAYWVAVLGTSALLILIWPAGKTVSLSQMLVNLTMLQEPLGVPNVDGVYWTLWTELRFYVLVVLLALVGITGRRVLAFCIAWPLVAQVAIAQGWQTLSHALIADYASLFAGGMLIYLIFREGHGVVSWLAFVGNTALAVSHLSPALAGSLTENSAFWARPWAVGLSLILSFVAVALIALTRVRDLQWRWLLPLGTLTYPLYLTHQYWGLWVVDNLSHRTNRWVVLAAATLFAFALAWLLERVERRMAPFVRRRVDRSLRRLAQSVAALVRGKRSSTEPEPVGGAARAAPDLSVDYSVDAVGVSRAASRSSVPLAVEALSSTRALSDASVSASLRDRTVILRFRAFTCR